MLRRQGITIQETKGGEIITTQEDKIAFEAKTKDEQDKIRGKGPVCPNGHPEVWNALEPIGTWRWNIRYGRVACHKGLQWSECRACKRWFNDELNIWESERGY